MRHVLSAESNDTGCAVIRANGNREELRLLFIERSLVEGNKNRDSGKLRFVRGLCEATVNVLISQNYRS